MFYLFYIDANKILKNSFNTKYHLSSPSNFSKIAYLILVTFQHFLIILYFKCFVDMATLKNFLKKWAVLIYSLMKIQPLNLSLGQCMSLVSQYVCGTCAQ